MPKGTIGQMNGPLTREQVTEFQRDGYVVCQNLLDAAAHADVVQRVEELASWPTTADRWQHYFEQTESGPVLTRTENFLPFHTGLRQLLTAGILNEAVGQLFDEPAVVFKEKINYKLPGGGGFAPHQDAKAYAFGSSHVTCLVAVDANRIDNGCLWFVPGKHQEGLLETDSTGCLPPAEAATMKWIAAPMAAGDVTFFSSFAPHKSAANHSSAARRSLYVTYSRGSEGDLRQAYYGERQQTMSKHNGTTGEPPRISTIGHFQGRGVK